MCRPGGPGGDKDKGKDFKKLQYDEWRLLIARSHKKRKDEKGKGPATTTHFPHISGALSAPTTPRFSQGGASSVRPLPPILSAKGACGEGAGAGGGGGGRGIVLPPLLNLRDMSSGSGFAGSSPSTPRGRGVSRTHKGGYIFRTDRNINAPVEEVTVVRRSYETAEWTVKIKDIPQNFAFLKVDEIIYYNSRSFQSDNADNKLTVVRIFGFLKCKCVGPWPYDD